MLGSRNSLDAFEPLIELLRSGKVDISPVLTGVVPATGTVQAMEELLAHPENNVKGLNTHSDPEAYAALARDPEVRVVVSNTTEAGIACPNWPPALPTSSPSRWNGSAPGTSVAPGRCRTWPPPRAHEVLDG